VKRKRKMMPFFILVMLERGRHKSVIWETEDTCVVDSSRFCTSLALRSERLRSSLEFLKRTKYLTELEITHGNIKLTIAPRPRRLVEEAA
jgi:hypothetical protein